MTRMLFKDVAQEWLMHRQANLKAPTFARYQWLIGAVSFDLGDVSMDAIDRLFLQNFTNDFKTAPLRRFAALKRKRKLKKGAKAPKPYGLSTISNALQIVKAVLRYAAEVGYCSPLETYKVDLPKIAGSMGAKRVKALSQLQFDQALLKLKKIIVTPTDVEAGGGVILGADNNRRYALGCLVALGTGMRIGEVAAQRYDRDFDPATNDFYVTHTIVTYKDVAGRWIREETDPKTESSMRKIPIDPTLGALFEHYAPRSGFLLPCRFDPKAVPNPANLRNWYNSHIRPQGSNITFHNLRHTYATRLLSSGVDYKTVSQLLGHAQVRTTMEIYAQTDDDIKREAISKVKW